MSSPSPSQSQLAQAHRRRHSSATTSTSYYYLSLFFQIGVVALAVFVYRFYSRYYDWTPCGNDPPIEFEFQSQSQSQSHLNDGSDVVENNQQITYKDPCKLFSNEYLEARNKFRHAVKRYKNHQKNNIINKNNNAAEAELWSFPVVVLGDDDSNGDSNDESSSLTLDVAVLPGNTQELGTIVHSSGVHGVEGYAGSAIQLAWLEMLLLSTDDNNDKNDNDNHINNNNNRPTIVMVHAVNPVGMKEYRRCNENNVDLNRNGIIISDENKADGNNNDGVSYSSFEDFLAKRDPNIAAEYDDFRHLFAPDTIDDDDDNDDDAITGLSLYETTVGYYVKAVPALWKHGMLALKRAMVAGQYHHPEGLIYGGQERQVSVQRLLDFFIRDRPEFFRDSPSVIWIDVHTGLGPFGKDSIHYNHEYQHKNNHENKNKNEQDHLRLPEPKDYFSTAYSVTKSVARGESTSEAFTSEAFKGYDLAKGMLMELFADSYRKLHSSSNGSGGGNDSSKSGIFLMQEFGTLPTILVGRALILDNILYQFLNRGKTRQSNEEEEDQKQRFSYRSPFLKQAFYPQSTEWRNSIVQRGLALALQAIEYSTANAKVHS